MLDPSTSILIGVVMLGLQLTLTAGSLVVADTKGKLTDVYKLKRKWLRLQEGIEIREVYRR